MKMRKIFKDKKGFLLAEETLKIVISVISITFLVGFLASLYFNNQTSKDLESAESSLNFLMNEIDLGRTEIEIYNPVGWSLISWEEEIPLSCLNVGLDNCLCICKNPFFKTTDNFLKNCDKQGFCLESDFIVNEEDNRIEIKNPSIILSINYETKIIKG